MGAEAADHQQSTMWDVGPPDGQSCTMVFLLFLSLMIDKKAISDRRLDRDSWMRCMAIELDQQFGNQLDSSITLHS